MCRKSKEGWRGNDKRGLESDRDSGGAEWDDCTDTCANKTERGYNRKLWGGGGGQIGEVDGVKDREAEKGERHKRYESWRESESEPESEKTDNLKIIKRPRQ